MSPQLNRQRGAATLIVVMVLFFIMSMVAAYTSRNLIFEQRTSANQLRSTQASEAAEAGLQWALGLLNSGRIGASCMPSVNVVDTSFRQRYLFIDGSTGLVTPIPKVAPLPPAAVLPTAGTLEPSCVFNGTTWNCSCPTTGEVVAPTLPSGSAVSPAFRVRFRQHPIAARGQLVRIEVNGCTLYSEACLRFDGAGADNEGRARATAYVTLKGAVTSAPTAALTARTTIAVNPGGPADLSLFNSNPKGSGVTAQAGGAVTPVGLRLQTIPGSPNNASFIDNDASLMFADFAAADRANAMFVATFGMRWTTYRDQPGTVILNCVGNCTAAQVRTAGDQNPGRVIWLNGGLNVDTGGDIGSAAAPLAIVATGNGQFTTNATIYGLVYSQATDWGMAGSGAITGAAMAESAVSGTSTATIAYDADILNLLRYGTGSFVMVPGTWKDF